MNPDVEGNIVKSIPDYETGQSGHEDCNRRAMNSKQGLGVMNLVMKGKATGFCSRLCPEVALLDIGGVS